MGEYVFTEEELLIKGSYNQLSDEKLLIDGQSDFCVILNTN